MVRYGHRVRQAKGLGGRTVWSEDLNTRMVESKSARILNDFNGFSDETADSAPRYINRLETQSEYITPSRPTFADGGHLKWRVRSEAKRHDNPGIQRSHSIPHLHVWLLLIPDRNVRA